MESQRYRSGIFWHFTGSPNNVDWGRVTKPGDILKQGTPTSDEEAVSTALKILQSKKLKGTCQERVSETQRTNKFCCVTDIPIKDLHNHARYYGHVAIGFSSWPIHKHFLPVIYLPTEQLPASKEYMKPNESALDYANDCYKRGNIEEAMNCEEMAWSLYGERVVAELDCNAVGSFLVNFLKLTEFNILGEESFYAEREWRHVGDFDFEPDHVEAIIAPKSQLNRIREFFSSNEQYAKHSAISLVSWEFVQIA